MAVNTDIPVHEPEASAEVFRLMEKLRNDGWCVVMKCLPRELDWIIQGTRSEYDAGSGESDKAVGREMWCCHAEDMVWGQPGRHYRHSQLAFRPCPIEAIRAVCDAIEKDREWRETLEKRSHD